MKTQLIATKAMSYGGRSMKPGAVFDATGAHARVLVAIGKAAYQTRVMVAAPPAPPPAPAPAPTPAPETAPPPPPVPPEAPAAKPPVARKTVARKTTGKSAE